MSGKIVMILLWTFQVLSLRILRSRLLKGGGCLGYPLKTTSSTGKFRRSNANLNNNNRTSTTNNSRSVAKPFQRPLPALEQHTLPSLEHPLPSLLDQDSEKEDETTAALSFENGQGSLLKVPSSEFDNTKLEDGAVQTGSQRKGVLKKQLFSTFSLASRSVVELLGKDRE